MNFLAHAFLAGDIETDRVGGVLGDFVKGPLPAGLPAGLAAGVALHRAIDGFADRQPAFAASRARISATRRRVGGVLVDLFYDHLLAKAWGNYHALPLHVYAARTYAELAVHARELPAQASEIAVSMRRGDWLSSYRDIANVGDAIDRMSVYRMRRANPLSGGVEEYLADAEGFSEDFASFLPDALAFAQNWQATRQRVEPPAG